MECIAKQRNRWLAWAGCRRRVPALAEYQVGVPVAVKVQCPHTAADRFDHQGFSRFAILVNEVQAKRLCDIGEMDVI